MYTAAWAEGQPDSMWVNGLISFVVLREAAETRAQGGSLDVLCGFAEPRTLGQIAPPHRPLAFLTHTTRGWDQVTSQARSTSRILLDKECEEKHRSGNEKPSVAAPRLRKDLLGGAEKESATPAANVVVFPSSDRFLPVPRH